MPAVGWLGDFLVGPAKFVTPPGDLDPAGVLTRFNAAETSTLAELASGTHIAVTPDPARRPVTRATHVREHFRTSGSPDGHGYTRRNADQGTAYYAFDHGIVRCVVLDTVNEHGGWQGSLDTGQPSWLVAELRECAARPVLLFSHHPLETMVNDLRPPGAGRRVLGPELRDVLLAHPCVIGWVNGHTHVHAIQAVREDGAPGGFWQITTASHIDWPQQARLIELFETDGGLVIGCTVIDSAAPASYRGRMTRTWPTRPCWLRWHASSPPTTGRSATRSAPKAAWARASRPTGMRCSRSTGPGRCRASADRPLLRYRVPPSRGGLISCPRAPGATTGGSSASAT